MPSRKQRKRRQKERRHEYEVVYVDDEGNELDVPPSEQPKRARDGAGSRGKPAKGGRAIKESSPPSWQRSSKRALLFFPLFFIVFSVVNKSASVEARLVASLGYSGLFVPLTYAMDRMAYKTYLRRSGQAPQSKKR